MTIKSPSSPQHNLSEPAEVEEIFHFWERDHDAKEVYFQAAYKSIHSYLVSNLDIILDFCFKASISCKNVIEHAYSRLLNARGNWPEMLHRKNLIVFNFDSVFFLNIRYKGSDRNYVVIN